MKLCMLDSESIRSSPVTACLDSNTFQNTPTGYRIHDLIYGSTKTVYAGTIKH